MYCNKQIQINGYFWILHVLRFLLIPLLEIICPEGVSSATENCIKIVILLKELVVFSSMQKCQMKKYSSCTFLFLRNLFLIWVLSGFDR